MNEAREKNLDHNLLINNNSKRQEFINKIEQIESSGAPDDLKARGISRVELQDEYMCKNEDKSITYKKNNK